jgi:hypothetical protein
MSRKCPICGGEVVEVKVRVAPSGMNIGLFNGYRCSSCGEEFLAERSLEPAHGEIVRAGIFGKSTHTLSSSPAIPLSVKLQTFVSLTSNDGPRINGIEPARIIKSISRVES